MATVIVIVALEAVGFLERRASIKIYPLIYEARGRDQTAMLHSILDAMDKAGERLTGLDTRRHRRPAACELSLVRHQEQHERLHAKLLAEPAIDALLTFRDPEED